MLLGSGMVARAFSDFGDDPSVLIFASGVSNSSGATAEDYARERDLLDRQVGTTGRIIYFSTSSIHDPSLSGSGYIRHKLDMESRISERFPDHTIFRLPNLVGHTRNPHTLCNFIRDRILADEAFEVHANACRYLMDMDTVAAACGTIIRRGLFKGRIVEVCFDGATTLPELVGYMEHLLGRTARTHARDKGACYPVDNTEFKAFWTTHMNEPWPGPDAWKNVLKKYYGPATRPA